MAAGIAIGAATLRLWSIAFGLPAIYRPDENVTVGRAMGVLHGVLDPHFADWPHLYFYLSALVLAPLKLVGLVTDQPSAHLAVRSLTAVLGVALVLVVLEFGRRAYGWSAGVLAAAAVAVSFLMVRDSHFGTLDVPLALACTSGLYIAYRTIGVADMRAFITNGAALGIAAGIKYSGAFLFVGLTAAQAIQARSAGWSLSRLAQRLALIAGMGVAVFLLGSPFLVLDPGMTAHGLGYIFGHLASTTEPQIGYIRLVIALWYGLDPGLFILAVLGLIYAGWRRTPADIVLLSFVAVYYLVIGAGHSVFLRYADTIIPALMLMAGRAAADIAGFVRDRAFGQGVGTTGVGALTLAAIWVVSLAPAVVHDLRYDVLIGQTDTRTLAYDWLAAHVPQGGRVAIPYKPGPAHDQAMIDSRAQSVSATDPYVASFLENRFESQYTIRDLSEDDLQSLTPDQLVADGVQYVVIARKNPELGCATPTPLELALQRRAPPVATFSPTSNDCPESVFDSIDTYYVPLGGYAGWVRPGPPIRIYRLNS